MDEKKDDVKPVAMSGFTILQILAWTNAEIARCRDKLETEPSGRVVAFLQGKIPGCKFTIKAIRDIFAFADAQYDSIEHPAEIGSLAMEQILGAEIDAEELKKNELWVQVLGRIEERIEVIKNILLKKAKKSRELDEYQGEYQGMTHYEKVFGSIKEQNSFWKNSLFRKGDEGDGTGTRDTNDGSPTLPAPALPAPEDGYPPNEDYDDLDDRQDDDPNTDMDGPGGGDPA